MLQAVHDSGLARKFDWHVVFDWYVTGQEH